MFPLSTVLFPGGTLALHVFEERYQAMMAECIRGDGLFGVVLIARGSEVGGGDQRFDVGTVARITDVAEVGGGRLAVRATGERRVRIDEWCPDDPYPVAHLADAPSAHGDGDGAAVAVAEAAVRRLRALLSELGTVPAIRHDLRPVDRPEDRGWQLCDLAPLGTLDLQGLLVTDSLAERLTALGDLCDARAADVVALLGGE